MIPVMDPAWFWRGGRLRRMFAIGVFFGISFGVQDFVKRGSFVRAAVAATFGTTFFGVTFVGAMDWLMRRPLKGVGRDLRPGDRVMIHRAVILGDDIGDPRLAPAVIEYSHFVRRWSSSRGHWHWLLVLLSGTATVALALRATVAGPTRDAIGSWFGMAMVNGMWLSMPRTRARSRRNAERAEVLARQLLGGSSHPGAPASPL
jgi:hypothetical protein